MRYNQLGNTGLYVSNICLGTMTFGGQGYWKVVGNLEQPAATRLIGRALEAGVNFIDTADVYSEGRSEQMVGQAFKDLGLKRSDVVLATKCYGRVGRGVNDIGASRGHILDAVERSLKRLNTDYIDLYQIHANDPVTPVEETMGALDDLVRRGLVRYAAVSNWQAWKIVKANEFARHRGLARLETLQAYYSIAGRDLERELVPMLADQKMGLLVWSPLAGGLLSGKFGPGSNGPDGARRTQFDFPPVDKERAFRCIEMMREVARAHDVSVARIALAFVLAKPFVTSVIIGAKTEEQLNDNLAASGLELTTDEIARLDEVSALPAEYPGWMLARQSTERVPGPR
ncbi:MAG: aldo/keto reductase [Alphaproteobacteria bacterium]|nr:aldo/keto reductase [Alphaproteobacteria bacterium]